jgi:hypothetical protein
MDDTTASSNSNNIIVYGPKFLKMAGAYIIVQICANYLSQIYVDKVLINQENPPKLENFVTLFIILDTLVTIFIMIGAYLAIPMIAGDENMFEILKLIAIDHFIYIGILSVIGVIIANVMYNKKYFMYKDDGLRAIRGFKEIMLGISIFLCILPFFLIAKTESKN